ncbi:phage major capsid protein [Roseibium sp. Sym1]|uniref:phage major capsid protein n=1 Tax=Roseibium sp. Sym1 TaxID=3016006 RepID=UPI0022B5A591|nr:phage major capsid protein [Roseibium sp. Sym1]
MTALEKAMARLKDLLAALDAAETKAVAEDATAEDVSAFEQATKDIEDQQNLIKQLKSAEATRAAAALPADEPADPELRTPATPKVKLVASEKIGLMVAAMAKAYQDEGARGYKATMRYLEEAGYGEVAKEFAVARSANSSAAAAGGVLVPENMQNEIIDILRPNTTFLQGAGLRQVPLVNGNYSVPAAASGATAAWRGEGKPANVSTPTFKSIKMSTKFLDCLVPVTNQLIRFSLPDVRSWIEMDMSQEMGTKVDLAAYLGSGTEYEPLGLTKIDGISEVTATDTASPTVTQIESDCQALELTMMNANLPMIGAEWRMSPRTLLYLQDLRDGNGNRYFPELQGDTPMFRNKRVRVTTQIPINGGTGTNESEIFLMAFGHLYYGYGPALSFAVSTEASFTSGGTTTSAFQNDLTLIKASAEADVDARYLEAVAVLRAVKWGS